MKKLLSLLALFALSALIFTSCKCFSEKQQKESEVVDVPVKQEIILEDCIKQDFAYMAAKYERGYCWYEAEMTSVYMFDDLKFDGKISCLVDVFQVLPQEDGNFDPFVVMITHTNSGNKVEEQEGYWLEDVSMYQAQIKLTYEQALEKLNEVNCIKPHSRYCTLRNPLGPVSCNPQYIIGNNKLAYFIDATTGEFSDKNPAFKGFEIGFKGPLGEWP